ncbi:MAG: hypothetical protein JJU41_00055 [Bacteroidetes bacterium]|nr:hypothetical protein [Bacteroidota bacterium]MCH8525433.1 hypothetical protein [Balneolales bacterium]
MARKTTITGHFVRMPALMLSLLLFMLVFLFASATPSVAQLSDNIRFSGYVQGSPVRIAAEMPGAASDEIWWEYRLQQRLNLAYLSDSGFSMHWQMRTRLFAGDLVRDVPGYAGLIDTDAGLVNASWMVAQRDSWFLHHIPDRFYAEWDRGEWNIRVGRQRVNWGVNLISNPNDLFNLYSFYDFDYPERPGSDAVRVQRFLGFNSRMEVAVSPASDLEQSVAAFLYAFDARGYDIQLIGGYYRKRFVAGTGFAGDFRGAGIKGELSYYSGLEGVSSTYIAAVSVDYMFQSGMFGVMEALYNHRGGMDDFMLFGANLAPDNPSLTRYQLTSQVRYALHPLVDGSMAAIWYPDEQGVFVSPALTWSAAQNLDVQVLGQWFAGSGDSIFSNSGRVMTASVTWSF